jgi:hypothetical protein
MDLDYRRSPRGAIAGVAAAGVWALQQPLDIKVFGVPYDDTELLGKFVTRSRAWRPVGIGIHLAFGAAVGAAYGAVARSLPVPPPARGLLFALTEHLATWPGTRLLPAVHPAASDFPVLWGDHAAFAQATWRHLLFGAVLGGLESALASSR